MVEFIIIDLFIILELSKIFDLVIVESLIEDSSTVESTSVEPDASEISSKNCIYCFRFYYFRISICTGNDSHAENRN